MTSEAASRTPTSRAYYAAFWRTCNLLEAKGITLPLRSQHDFCWRTFGNVRSAEGDKLRELGFALRARRIHADYHDYPLTIANAQNDVLDAEELIAALNAIFTLEWAAIALHAQDILNDYV